MTNAVSSARDHYAGQTYQDIALADGDDLPPVLRDRSNPPQPIADIPFSRYTDRAFFDLEMQKMWRRVWQYACREEHVPEVGDYYVYDLGRASLIIVRTPQGLRAYHNSCLHRGTKLKPSQSSGWSASIQCPFHGWDWNLDGSLKSVRCDWEFPHLQKDKAGLRQARVESWNGFRSPMWCASRNMSPTVWRRTWTLSSPTFSTRIRISCAGSVKGCMRARRVQRHCRSIRNHASGTCTRRSTNI